MSGSKTTENPFDTLLTELDTLAKAHKPDDDKKIESAAKEKDEDDEDEDEDDEEGGEMRKSFSVKLSDGSDLEVEDGAALVKALTDRFEASEQKVLQTLDSAVAVIKSQGALIKSLSDNLDSAQTAVKAQDTLVKSLQADLKKIGSTGAGRKTVVSVSERQSQGATETMAKGGMPEGVSTEEFFAKADEKQKAGRITGADIALAEACLNSGQQVPANLIHRVMA
jgi:hypothetical protein